MLFVGGFSEIRYQELSTIDGGVDWKKLGSGIVDTAVGVGEIAIGVTGIFIPEPMTSIGGGISVYKGTQDTYKGFEKIFSSF